MDSDKVLVMEGGEAVEFDSPHELLKNSEGYFSKMLKETGPSMEAKLRKVAEEAFVSRNTIVGDTSQNHKSDQSNVSNNISNDKSVPTDDQIKSSNDQN